MTVQNLIVLLSGFDPTVEVVAVGIHDYMNAGQGEEVENVEGLVSVAAGDDPETGDTQAVLLLGPS